MSIPKKNIILCSTNATKIWPVFRKKWIAVALMFFSIRDVLRFIPYPLEISYENIEKTIIKSFYY